MDGSIMKFEHEGPGFTVKVETTAVDIDAILEDFNLFLKGCGFQPQGRLEYLLEDDESPYDS